jgi:hypothetical protein
MKVLYVLYIKRISKSPSNKNREHYVFPIFKKEYIKLEVQHGHPKI